MIQFFPTLLGEYPSQFTIQRGKCTEISLRENRREREREDMARACIFIDKINEVRYGIFTLRIVTIETFRQNIEQKYYNGAWIYRLLWSK